MKNKLNLFMFTLAFVVPLFMTVDAQATIYKCVNLNAEVYYNDKPCPLTDIESQIKAAKDPVGGYIPPAFVKDDEGVGTKGVLVGGIEKNQNNLSGKKNSDNYVIKGSVSSNTDNSADSENNDSNETDIEIGRAHV